MSRTRRMSLTTAVRPFRSEAAFPSLYPPVALRAVQPATPVPGEVAADRLRAIAQTAKNRGAPYDLLYRDEAQARVSTPAIFAA
jgi:hypothetical protein